MYSKVAVLDYLADQKKGTIQIEDDTFWNGHAFMPLKTIQVKFKNDNWDVTVLNERQFNESTKESVFGHSDQNNYSINASCKLKMHVDFRIYNDYNVFLNYFKPNRKLFKIDCKNAEFKNAFNSKEELLRIFNYAKEYNEFTPVIFGYTENGKFKISINFNLRTENKELFDLIFSMLDDLMFYFDSSKV